MRQSKRFKQLSGFSVQFFIIDQNALTWEIVQPDILCHSHIGNNIDFLVHYLNAGSLCIQWLLDARIFSVDQNRSAVCLIHAAQDLYQG